MGTVTEKSLSTCKKTVSSTSMGQLFSVISLHGTIIQCDFREAAIPNAPTWSQSISKEGLDDQCHYLTLSGARLTFPSYSSQRTFQKLYFLFLLKRDFLKIKKWFNISEFLPSVTPEVKNK